MIYFRDNGEIREKYEILFDKQKLVELQRKVAKRCGEQSIVKKECKLCYIPRSDSFYQDRDSKLYHYCDEVHYKVSGNKTTEWDHYDEYEVDLYNCDYKDYICPVLVNFIEKIRYNDDKSIEALFNHDFQSISKFLTVKEKIVCLQEEIADVSQDYLIKRKEKVDELNLSYEELTKKAGDIEQHIKELNSWTSKMKKELLNMDKKHVSKMKELNDKLKYLLSIEKLNESQEDSSKYIEELLSFVDIRLVDTISLEEIERVRSFQSKELPEKEMKLLKQK